MSKTSTFISLQSDDTLVRTRPDGTEETVEVYPPAPASDKAITAAAWRDPDAQPLTDTDLARMQRVPRIKTLRRALGLAQEEFAARYHIPWARSAIGNRGIANRINLLTPILL